MKTIYYFSLSMVLSAILFSCKKSDDVTAIVPPAVQPGTTLLSKAVYSAVGTYDYTYDAQNRVKTETYSGNASNPATFTTFTGYDSDGKLTSYNVHYPATPSSDCNVLVSYNSNGKVDKEFIYDIAGPLSYYYQFTYASPLVTVKFYSSTGSVINSNVYTYGTDGKNVIQYKTYNSAGTLTFTTVYSNFDSKKTAENLLPAGYSTLPPSENNWLTYNRTNNSTGAVISYNNTYQYNDDGYPLKRTSDNGSTIDYQYTKK